MDNIAMTPASPQEMDQSAAHHQQHHGSGESVSNLTSSSPSSVINISDQTTTTSGSTQNLVSTPSVETIGTSGPINGRSISQMTLVSTVNDDPQAAATAAANVCPPTAFRDAKDAVSFNGSQKYTGSNGIGNGGRSKGMTGSTGGVGGSSNRSATRGLGLKSTMGMKKGKQSFVFNECWKLAVIFILILILILITLRLWPRLRNPTGNICLTHGCVTAASRMIDYMDETVPPCEDFYQFACGGFIRKNLIRDDRSSTSQFNIIQDDLDYKLRLLLEPQQTASTTNHPLANHSTISSSTDLQPSESVTRNQTRPQFLQNVFDYYESCTDVAEIEARGDKPLTDLIDSLGGWPVVSGPNWNREQFNWEQSIIELRQRGHKFNTLFEVYVTADLKNNTIHRIYVDQPQFGLYDRKILLKGMKEPAVEAYYNLMVDMAVFLGAERERATEEMKSVLEFETRLATHALDKEERRNFTALYNKMSLKELSQLSPNINWLNILNKFMVNPIQETETVIVFTPNYIKKTDEIIKQADSRVLANYLMWRVVHKSTQRLSAKYRERYQKFETVITGKKSEEPRWERCLKDIRHSKLSIALSYSYLREYFNDESKHKIMEMVEYIQSEFKQLIRELDWMDATTKQQALRKAELMSNIIAYPKEVQDATILAHYFESLKINPGTYFENYFAADKFETDKNFEKLREPKIHNDWRGYANVIEVNAYYHPLENAIVFPAGILQGVFFGGERPQYLNFGAIGYVIGHEITHGFDDKGRQFDEQGLQRNWWDEATEKHFNERKQCIIDQYGNYTVPENGMQINGINTQGENIADNGGIREAFRAYRSYVRDKGEEERLPGLNDYTPEQLFWMSAAQTWCGKHRPESLKLRILTGFHSPGRFRVNGPLSNSPQFSESFGCAKGSPMNPPNKCTVW